MAPQVLLQASFQRMLPGLSAKREQALWGAGILCWEALEAAAPYRWLRPAVAGTGGLFAPHRDALANGDLAFFARRLPATEHWRVLASFPADTLFLDIETTGLSRHYDQVTLVGWSQGNGGYRVWLHGEDDGALRAAMRQAKAVVTFNGTTFDLPFLRRHFPDFPEPVVHVDLRYLARRVGLTGGQKRIENRLGFRRAEAVGALTSEAAPVLWYRYTRGETEALRLLIDYNWHDLLGMRRILDATLSRLLREQGFPAPLRALVPTYAPRGRRRLPDLDECLAGASGPRSPPAWQGRRGPAVVLADLTRHAREPTCVVGIDLTGSERRPSGWCQLSAGHALTRTLRTDADLLAATVAARPTLVSIDSPLSLPRGRTRVTDDDPGRAEFGIMRECERALKRRGIAVYPALIPSMQRLTERGIRLAAALRGQGLPVIESYPGAAQDILGIPRKRASLAMLREGLRDFGLSGPFLDGPTSHDELDAITAAVVGLFFWCGRYEALGSAAEGTLIIPAAPFATTSPSRLGEPP